MSSGIELVREREQRAWEKVKELQQRITELEAELLVSSNSCEPHKQRIAELEARLDAAEKLADAVRNYKDGWCETSWRERTALYDALAAWQETKS